MPRRIALDVVEQHGRRAARIGMGKDFRQHADLQVPVGAVDAGELANRLRIIDNVADVGLFLVCSLVWSVSRRDRAFGLLSERRNGCGTKRTGRGQYRVGPAGCQCATNSERRACWMIGLECYL